MTYEQLKDFVNSAGKEYITNILEQYHTSYYERYNLKYDYVIIDFIDYGDAYGIDIDTISDGLIEHGGIQIGETIRESDYYSEFLKTEYRKFKISQI